MTFELPLYRQQKDNTCALACLRMVLAAAGISVAEDTLVAKGTMEDDGTHIDELQRLARQYGLMAEVQMTTVEDLQHILADGRIPLTYIDRAIFDLTPRQREVHRLATAKIHVVIPTRVTASSVTYHDPIAPSITRRSIRLFRLAYEKLGGACVVCARPTF